jgi:hypothetical protein
VNILSLGAGVQSSTMALMAAHCEITPMPDCAIFADTQAEPQHVYDWLDWLRSENVLPFPVHIVTAGSLWDDTVNGLNSTGQRLASIPAFTSNQEKEGGGLLRRQCTSEYKILPVMKKARELMGYKPRQRIPKDSVSMWIGISTDEIMRVKPSRFPFIENRHPLIEAGISRRDCMKWMERHEYPAPAKSSCVFCPYHNNATWRDMKVNAQEEFAKAVEFDAAIRDDKRGKVKEQLYIHRSLKPLGEVDFRNEEDKGQLNMFNNECEGMCGI